MARKTQVLIVEDDDELRNSLSEQLSLYEGYECTTTGTGREALKLAADRHYDVVLLDVRLPDIDGRELCRLLRRRGAQMPVIMLTAVTGDADMILGLESGANDYVVKPFRMSVLRARMRAQLRQHAASENASFSIGPYIFRPSRRVLFDSTTEEEIFLSDKECAILRYLHRAGDRVVGRETLYEEIWGHNAPLTTHTLQTHVYRLRKKIEREPSDPRILVSEAGGYRVVR